MTFKDYTKELLTEAFNLSDQKGNDYRKGSPRVHANFISVGNHMRVHPLIVLGVYMKKHFDAISNYFATDGKSESEPIRERVKDAINYLILGMPLADGQQMVQETFDEFRKAVGSDLVGVADKPDKPTNKSYEAISTLMDTVTSQGIPKAVEGNSDVYIQNAIVLIAALITALYWDEQG